MSAAGCSVDGCGRPMKARSWCVTHYARWRKHGEPGDVQVQTRTYEGAECAVATCDKRPYGHGYCQVHWQRWKTHGDADYVRPIPECSVDGCPTRAKDKGMCGRHAARTRRHGTPGGAELLHAVSYDGMECSIDDCTRRPKARGWCLPHYKRWCRWGDPMVKRPTVPATERFRSRVVIGPVPEARPGLGHCHLWTGGKIKQGYGSFYPATGQKQLAHRWAYIQAGGTIPDDYVLDHLCRVRLCVNPAHLEPVTNLENMRRGLGYALRNGMRKSCIHGHRYTPDNTYLDPQGGIRCRTCARGRDSGRSRPSRKAA